MYQYISTVDQLQKVVEEDLIPYVEAKYVLALDLETYSDNPDEVPRPIPKSNGRLTGNIRTLQLGLDPLKPMSLDGKQFIIDVQKIDKESLIRLLKPVLENATVLGHNIKYDYQFLRMCLGISLRKMIDTMLIGQILYAGAIKNHGLVDVYAYTLNSREKYAWFQNQTGMSFSDYKDFKKSQQKEDWSGELSEDNLKYAAHDVFFIFYCLEEFKHRIDRFEKTYERGIEEGTGIRSVISLEFRLIPVYALMELRGIHVNLKYHTDHVISLLETEKEKAKNNCSNLTRTYKVTKHIGRRPKRVEWEEEVTEPININSPMQLKPKLEELLSTDLGEKIVLEGTGEDIIKRFLNDPLIKDRLSQNTIYTLTNILYYKKASSLLSKFGEKLLEVATDRSYIHPSWFQMGGDEGSVSSGRSSCKNINIQQIPSRGFLFKTPTFDGYEVTDLFRTTFNADEGYTMVCADYSQIEARLAALVCKADSLVERFNAETIDIYGAIAKAMMDLDFEPQKESKDEYERYLRNYVGKTAGLSLLYGTHWKKLGRWMFDKTEGKVKWNDSESERAYKNFFKNFPEFAAEMIRSRESVKALAKEAGETLYPFTRRNKDGELVPFYVAQSFTGFKRPRRFVLKPEHLRLDEYTLSSKAAKIELEDGRLRSNIYNQELSAASREAFNHRIQSTAANILKYAAYLVHNAFIKAGFHWSEGIVALVHDEILCHVRKENEELTKKIVCDAMKVAGERLAPGLVFNIKAKSADNWAKAK